MSCRNERKRGFQHIYKSDKTASSKRVKIAFNATTMGSASGNKNAKKRDGKKARKIASLRQVAPSPQHAVGTGILKRGPLFFSGTTKRTVPNNPVLGSFTLSAIQDLEVVDTIEGARMKSTSGDTIFVLVPRCDAIASMTRVNNALAALYALDQAKTTSEKRGKTRIPCAENNGKYATVGLKPARSRPGIVESWPRRLGGDKKQIIRNLMTRCQDVANGYIQSSELRGIQMAKLITGWGELDGGTPQSIWGSLASARNHYLNSHTDADFFYSLLTTVSAHGLRDDIDRYRTDAEVCNYFTFAEQGIAVALRPGDILLFNPLYEHCLSSRTSAYETRDVFSLSMYLKTAIVGMNDNSLPLTESEKCLFF